MIGLIWAAVKLFAVNYIGSMLFARDYKSKMPPVHDYPVQSSAAGISVPIVLGTARLAGNVVFMGPLVAYNIKHTSGGGKGGGSKAVSYETKYRRTFLISICEGPATIIGAWKGKKAISVSTFTSYDGNDNSGISALLGENYAEYSNVCMAYFESYELGNSQSVPNFVFEVSNILPHVIKDYHNTGDSGQMSLGAATEWRTQTWEAGESYIVTSVKVKIWRHANWLPGIVTVSIRATDDITSKPTGDDICSGTTDGDTLPTTPGGGDAEWRTIDLGAGFTTESGTEYAIVMRCGYRTLYWRVSDDSSFATGRSSSSGDSGATWGVMNASVDAMFEVYERGIGGDMNFAEMIKELLINERYAGYDESDLITADFTSIIAYCETNNLKGSLALTEQKPLPDWLDYICSHFQGYFYEIGGKVGLNCYRSQASVLSITQDDLVREGKQPPIHTTKRNYSTTYNRLEATWTDRDNGYKTGVAPAFDRIDQRESGQVRTKTMDLKAITDDELASTMVWRIFIDQFYRFSQYTFKLGYKSMLLEVGDVIDVTDGHLLTAKKMRVISIEEEKDGRKATISAVEDVSDFYPSIAYAIQQSDAAGDPAITLTDATMAFRESHNDNKLHLSIVPGGTQCNGFYIYKSYDDTSYEIIGKSAIETVTGGGANSTGTIQSALLAHTAVIHRSGEWLDVSIGTLTDLDTAITDDAFFNNRKLARIDDEIIGYKTCVESSVEGTWRISNLIRGLFGTEAVAHASGETFDTLDIDFSYTLQDSDIGKTMYFKVVSFYADEIQLVSDVSSQSHVVSGNHIKPLPLSLMRINGREGLTTYETDDVTIDWYFCSKQSGFGRGGYGNALWGSYMKDPLLNKLRVELEEENGTDITEVDYDLDDYGEPAQLEILEADRNSKNPIRAKITPGSHLLSNETRSILIEKI